VQKNKKDKDKTPSDRATFKLEMKKIELDFKAYKSERKASWNEFKKLMKLEVKKLKVELRRTAAI